MERRSVVKGFCSLVASSLTGKLVLNVLLLSFATIYFFSGRFAIGMHKVYPEYDRLRVVAEFVAKNVDPTHVQSVGFNTQFNFDERLLSQVQIRQHADC